MELKWKGNMSSDEMQQIQTKILAGLEPLFEKAEKEELWFYSTDSQMWFSPKELRDYHTEGKCIWDAYVWKLRDPTDRLKELLNKVSYAEEELNKFKNRIMEWSK